MLLDVFTCSQMCEMSDDYSAFYNVGRQDSATFSASDSGVLQLSYNSSDGGNRYLFLLVCRFFSLYNLLWY